MVSMTFLIRIVVTLGFIVLSYWALQCVNLEKVILKNRVQEARVLFLLLAVWIGMGVASAIFSFSDWINSMIQLLMTR